MKISKKNSGVIILLALSAAIILPNDVSGKPKGFLSKIGVCTSVSNNELLAGAGYAYIEEGVQKFLIPEKSEAEFAVQLEAAKKSKLPVTACNGFLPGALKSVGAEAAHEKILEYSETAFRRAKTAGVKIIVFGSGGSRSIPEGFSRDEARKQFVSLLSKIGPIAAKYDVTIVIEPLNKKECNFINSVAEGGEIAKDVNHPNIKLLADIYHMKMDGEGPENIIKYGKLLRHTHIAEKEGRTAPGVHGEDFRPYFEALKKIKYAGAMSVECKWDDLNTQALPVLETIKKQISK